METDVMRKILHTMLRVADLRRSVDFYTQIMGMQVLRTLDQPDEKYSLVFLGYDDERRSAVLELTYNNGVSQYDKGNAFGHIAIGVENIHQAYADIQAKGGIFSLKPTLLNGSNEVIAFLADPDSYQLELIERC